MALIRATHNECGDVDLVSRDVLAYTFDTSEHPSGWYRFVCSHCGDIVLHDADPQAFDILKAAGCVIETSDPPKFDSAEIDDITYRMGVLAADEVIDTIGLLKRTSDLDIVQMFERFQG